jgi:hypothetical protein
MQIDQKFIQKICNVLTKKIVDFDQSAELQYLSLYLLKEVMSQPLNERGEKKQEKNVVSKQWKKLGKNVSKLKNLGDKVGTRNRMSNSENKNKIENSEMSAQVMMQ